MTTLTSLSVDMLSGRNRETYKSCGFSEFEEVQLGDFIVIALNTEGSFSISRTR